MVKTGESGGKDAGAACAGIIVGHGLGPSYAITLAVVLELLSLPLIFLVRRQVAIRGGDEGGIA